MSIQPPRLASAVVTALVAAAGAVVWSEPAHAAGCPGSGGVTVVVDFNQLGGGVQVGCDPAGGGRFASTVFPAAGFTLEPVLRTPGFTCRVSGKPVVDPCVNTPPATAYWSLWWSDGKSGSWKYASLGVGSLKVPAGGYLAFSWQGQSGRATPGFAPSPRASTAPNPTPDPSADDGKSPEKSRDKPRDKPRDRSPEPTPSASSASATPSPSTASADKPVTEPVPSDSPAEPIPTDSAPSDSPAQGSPAAARPPAESDRVPPWAGVLLVGGLLGSGAMVAYGRTRRGSGGASG